MFLWESLENEPEIAKSYLHLLACCDIYSGKSMALCQQFGEVGLVKTGIHMLHRIKKDKIETSRVRIDRYISFTYFYGPPDYSQRAI